MLHRFSFWTALFVFAVVGAVRAQTPAAAQPAAAQSGMAPGLIVAKQVTGKVSMILNGVTTELKNESVVSQAATIITANESSVILVFSNGATTQLGADTTLVIEEFLWDPFKQTVEVATLTEEPTTSHTKLRLSKGELVGKVAHLKHDQGSYFTVQTPVGAAGIRGTTFRIVFRPTGTGQAFAVFSLSTVEGNVNFQQGAPAGPAGPAQSGQPQGQAPADNQGQQAVQGQASPQGQAAAQGGGTSQQAPAGGVPVIGGQEVVVTVSVAVNPTTGSVVVTAPPTITSTQPISIQTQSLIVQQAQTLAATAATTSFTPAPATQTTPSNGGTQQQQSQQGDSNPPADSSNPASNSNSSNSTPSNSNPAPNQSGNASGNSTTNSSTPTNPAPSNPTPPPMVKPPVPPVTVTPPSLTPGAGRPQG